MTARVTRRRLAALAAGATAIAPAQTPVEDDLTIQRENLRRNREQLAKTQLPMATEPAFIFKV
ncbi:MAG: hypothetical protein HY235_21260 [Acidobacteria bacterium]|nr:hypothetical protein [Acidobacteriota bacterium]